MNQIIKSEERGKADHGWLKSRHTFSFADYYDPNRMGFGVLRVINEDRIQGGKGFGMHSHRDMEIISYVMSGGLKHQDSMKNSTVILPGEVQIMSAGTGVSHSEMNQNENEETHFLQIWILPNEKNLKPNYGQKSFTKDFTEKDVVLVVSGDGRDGSIAINQDANIFISKLNQNKQIVFSNRKNRRIWIQMIKGQIHINDQILNSGDALAATESGDLKIVADQNSEILIFDLPE